MLTRNLADKGGLANGTRVVVLCVVYDQEGVGSGSQSCVVEVPDFVGAYLARGESARGRTDDAVQFALVAHFAPTGMAWSSIRRADIRIRLFSKHGLPPRPRSAALSRARSAACEGNQCIMCAVLSECARSISAEQW